MFLSIESIRGRIQIYPKSWFHLLTTNCYAYALGLDIFERQICQNAYQPGVMAKDYKLVNSHYFSTNQVIQSMIKDLNLLGIAFREIEPQEAITKEEWKIALFTASWISDYGFLQVQKSDFHFIRGNYDGTWYHKTGYASIPTQRDVSKNVITDPQNCNIPYYSYRKCYALRLENKR